MLYKADEQNSTINKVLYCACALSWFGDVDAAEMFLCYLLDEAIRPYAGVDRQFGLPICMNL